MKNQSGRYDGEMKKGSDDMGVPYGETEGGNLILSPHPSVVLPRQAGTAVIKQSLREKREQEKVERGFEERRKVREALDVKRRERKEREEKRKERARVKAAAKEKEEKEKEKEKEKGEADLEKMMGGLDLDEIMRN